MQEIDQLDFEETSPLPAIVPTKKRRTPIHGLGMIFTLIGTIITLFLYFVLPMVQLFDFVHDWITQLLCAACIFIFIEGLIGLVLLSIAKSMPLPQVEHANELVEDEDTERLPAISTRDMPTFPLEFAK